MATFLYALPGRSLRRPSPRFQLWHLPRDSRSFHSTPRPQFLAEVISSSYSFIQGIHTITGLPWVAALPLTAVIVRTCITLPLTVYTRRNTQKQWDLAPLMTAWSYQIRRNTMREKSHLGPAVVTRDAAQALRTKRRELYSRWDCGYWKGFVPVFSLFVWLPVMETIRSMSGANSGIIGLIMGKDGSGADKIDNMPANAPGSILATGEDSASEVASDSLSSLQERHEFFEPTLSTEGGLWFPDLTAPDPLLLLPFALSASMFLNLMPSRRKALNIAGAEASVFQRRLTNALRFMALAAGPLTLQMPAAMLLYWTTSMTLGYVQGRLLDKYMPFRPPVLSCKPRSFNTEKRIDERKVS